jgi:site-specific recombinase XerC
VSRIEGASANSLCSLIRRFFDHLRREGFGAASRYELVRQSVGFVIAGGAIATRAAAVARIEEEYRGLLQSAKRPTRWHKAFIRFLTHHRLVRPTPWHEVAQDGRTDTLIASAPAAFRGELEAFRRDLVAERSYRAANRERRRSLVSEHAGFLALVRCARWLDEHGALGWQQMTAERLRAFTRDCGRGSSRFYAEKLALLRRFFAVLVGGKRLFRNPLAGVRGSLPIFPIEHATADEERAVWLARLQDAEAPAVTRAVGLLIVLHGLWPAEVSDLRLGDLRVRTRSLWLRRSRTSVPLDPITAAALDAYLAERKRTRNSHFFVSEYSWRLDRPVSNSFIRDRLLQVGVPGAIIARQSLIRDVLDRENPVVAARVLRLSIQRIHVYLRLFGKDKALQPRFVRAASQDRLAF